MSNVVNVQIDLESNIFAGIGRLHEDFTRLSSVIGGAGASIGAALDGINGKVKEIGDAISSMGMPGAQIGQGMADLSDIAGVTSVDLRNTAAAAEGLIQPLSGMAMAAAMAVAPFNMLWVYLTQIPQQVAEGSGSLAGFGVALMDTVGWLSNSLTLFEFFIDANRRMKVMSALCAGAQKIWSGVMMVFNATLWACPLTWIIAAIVALIGIIVLCVTKVQGWGKQWESITTFMKLCGQLFVASFKFEWDRLVNNIMIGIDRIKLAWYNVKSFLGLGDNNETEAHMENIRADIERRKQEIEQGRQNIDSLRQQAADALTWELSWKKSDDKNDLEKILDQPALKQSAGQGLTLTAGVTPVPVAGSAAMAPAANGVSGSTEQISRMAHNLKGTASYATIASQLKAATVAAATATMPLTAAATSIAERDPMADARNTEYMEGGRTLSMTKFCDTIEIHVANTDQSGQQQIRSEVEQVLTEFFEDYA